jgi:hypothetical protein
LICSLHQPGLGIGGALVYCLAVQVIAAYFVLRLVQALVGSLAVPFEGEFFVAINATAFFVAVADVVLCFNVTVFAAASFLSNANSPAAKPVADTRRAIRIAVYFMYTMLCLLSRF